MKRAKRLCNKYPTPMRGDSRAGGIPAATLGAPGGCAGLASGRSVRKARG